VRQSKPTKLHLPDTGRTSQPPVACNGSRLPVRVAQTAIARLDPAAPRGAVKNKFALRNTAVADQGRVHQSQHGKIVLQEAASIFPGLHLGTQATGQQCRVDFIILAFRISRRKTHLPVVCVGKN